MLSNTQFRYWILTPTFTWHLPFSTCTLCASCRMKPIVPSLLLLQPENAIGNNYRFPWKRMSPCIGTLFVPSGSSLRTHTHTPHAHSVVCVYVCDFCVSVWGLDHTWVRAYLHSICICFARGGSSVCWCKTFLSLRGQNRLFLCPRRFCLSHLWLQSIAHIVFHHWL